MSPSPATGRRHASVPGVYGSFRNRASGRGRSAGAGKNSQRQRHSLLSSVRAGSGSDTVFVAPPQSPRFGVRRRVVGPLGYAIERQLLARRGEDWRRDILSSAALATAVLPARPDWGYTQLCAQHDAEPSTLRPHGWRLRPPVAHIPTAVADVAVPRVNPESRLLSGPSRPPSHRTAARTCDRRHC